MKIGIDKFLHTGVCFLVTICVTVATYWLGETASILCGALFSLGLGLGKEFGDSMAVGNKWDWGDMLADVVGILVAVGIVLIMLTLL